MSNIAGGSPEFDFVPTNEEQNRDTDVLNSLVNYYLNCNKFDLLAQQWVREMILYGNGIIHVEWEGDKPKITVVPLGNFFVDPAATNMDNARYAGHDFFADKRELKKMTVYDPESDSFELRYDPKVLDELGNFDQSTDDFKNDKQAKDMFKGSTYGEEASSKQIRVTRIYDKLEGKIIEIGNGREIIYEEETYLQKSEVIKKGAVDGEGIPIEPDKKSNAIKPFLPYAVLRDYTDPSLFFAKGEVEVILASQSSLDDLENMDMDVLAITAAPMGQVDPQFKDLIPDIVTEPGYVLPIPRAAFQWLDPPVINGDLDSKKVEVSERMRRATAADEVVQGASQQQGRITATEVTSQLNQATQRFSTKVQNLESEGYAQLGSILFKFIQIFVDTKMAVRIAGPDGINFKDYDPWEFTGDYEPHVKLESTIKKHKLEQGMKLNQAYQVMMGNPAFDQKAISQWVVKQIDPEITDKQLGELMAPTPPPMGMPMSPTMAPGAAPPPMSPDQAMPIAPPAPGM